jgi:hypothetical protein
MHLGMIPLLAWIQILPWLTLQCLVTHLGMPIIAIIFCYQMHSPESITMACIAAAKPYMHGVTWSEFTVDTNTGTSPGNWYYISIAL